MLWVPIRFIIFESLGVFAETLISYLVKALKLAIFYNVVVWILKQFNLIG